MQTGRCHKIDYGHLSLAHVVFFPFKRWKCNVCKKLLPLAAQVDHVVPLAAGGADKMDNMQILCANCHAEKSRKEAKQGVHLDRGITNYLVKTS